jgi:hypothetical protein
MNLDAIKKKLESMQSKSTSGGANNQTKRFKPQIGKQTVRVCSVQIQQRISIHGNEILLWNW